jgi:hypothetical protein
MWILSDGYRRGYLCANGFRLEMIYIRSHEFQAYVSLSMIRSLRE